MNTFGACCFVGILICALAQQDEMINYQNCSFQKLAIKAGSVIFGADICSRSTFTEEKSSVFTHLVTNVITGSVADQLGIRKDDLLIVLGLNWETPSVEDLHLLTEQSSQQVQRIFSRLDEGRKFLLITASDGSETVTYVEALIRPTVVSCGIPPSVSYAQPNTANAISFPNSVTYTCVRGYSLTSGNATRQCLAGGKFSGNPPVCTPRIYLHLLTEQNPQQVQKIFSRLDKGRKFLLITATDENKTVTYIEALIRPTEKLLRRKRSMEVDKLTTEKYTGAPSLTLCLFSKPTHIQQHGLTEYLTQTGGNVVLGPIKSGSNFANFQKQTCVEFDSGNVSMFDFYKCPNGEYIFLGSPMYTNIVCKSGPSQQQGVKWSVPFDYRFKVVPLNTATQLGSSGLAVCLSSTSWMNGATIFTKSCDSSTNFICFLINSKG